LVPKDYGNVPLFFKNRYKKLLQGSPLIDQIHGENKEM